MNYYEKGNHNLNRDNQNDQRPERGQRSFPGRFPSQTPGMEGQPVMPPPGFMPQGPGMEGQPRTAPPNFIPEGPGMDRRSMEAPLGFGVQFRPGMQVRPREIRRCINRFTYIWLVNGNNFWFYPTFLDRQFVYGFRWRRNRWEYDRINLNRIIFFRCV